MPEQADKQKPDTGPDETVVYKELDGVRLSIDLFRPDAPKTGDALPCIVFFHGGGWNGGSPNQFHPHCRYLASRGMLAMSAEYRLKSVHGTTPYECVADGKSAVRWIRENAGGLGIDPERIAAGGGSAGGHVATATATLTGFDEADEDAAVSSKPCALVLFNPVFDNGPDGWAHDRVKERWEEFSPMHNIAEGMPPAIVFFGSEDTLVPVSTCREFTRRMAAGGARCDMWIYEGQTHAFFNYKDGTNPYYAATVYEADRFLASIGYLEGEPTLSPPDVEAVKL
jgi:acetyl esterase/lipase